MSRWDELFDKPPPERPSLVAVPEVRAGNATSYATGALRREAQKVAGAANGTRNATLFAAATSMAELAKASAIDWEVVKETLGGAALGTGLPQDEIDKVFRDGDPTGPMGRAAPRIIPPQQEAPAVTVLDVPDLEAHEVDAFWDSRDHLSHIWTYATARRVSPWAALGVVLARVAAATPYFVVLPPIVGGTASLNLFVGLVGKSGAGKGAAESVAAECLNVGHVETHTTGSGEGIAHGYMHRTRSAPEWNDDIHSVLFSVPEIDTLSALGNRQGATLMPELRRAWSGERLGFAYADLTKRLPVPAHEYRLCLVAGIQPARAQALLDDADGGTPQRFLWLPAYDPDAPDVPPKCPDPIRWHAPDTTARSPFRQPSGQIAMKVCDTARETIDANRLARLRGTGEALDGHGLLTRLKVAAALALLDHGRLNVTDEDWILAEVVHRKSDATRAGVQRQLQSANEERNAARAVAEAKRTLIVSETVEDAAVKRVSRAVVRSLRKADDWTPTRQLRHAVAARDRAFIDEALGRLADAGQIEVEEVDRGARYRLADKTS